GAIDHHADIVFLLNLAPLFDQEAFHFFPFGARLMGDQHFPQEFFGVGAHFIQAAGQLDAPRLSPSPGVNLRLDNPQIPAQGLRRLHRLFGGEGHLSPGDVHPILFQDLVSLVLVNIHASPASYPRFPPRKKKPGRFLSPGARDRIPDRCRPRPRPHGSVCEISRESLRRQADPRPLPEPCAGIPAHRKRLITVATTAIPKKKIKEAAVAKTMSRKSLSLFYPWFFHFRLICHPPGYHLSPERLRADQPSGRIGANGPFMIGSG